MALTRRVSTWRLLKIRKLKAKEATEPASAPDGGHTEFVERVFSDVPQSENLDPQELEDVEILKFEEANQRLLKLEQRVIAADEDGDLARPWRKP